MEDFALKGLIELIIKDNERHFNGTARLVELFKKFAFESMRDVITGDVEKDTETLKDKWSELTGDPFLVITQYVTENGEEGVEWHLTSSELNALDRIEHNLFYEYKGKSPIFTIYKEGGKKYLCHEQIMFTHCLYLLKVEKEYTVMFDNTYSADELHLAEDQFKQFVRQYEKREFNDPDTVIMDMRKDTRIMDGVVFECGMRRAEVVLKRIFR